MPLRMRPSSSGRGFTLVELLVVIAILAVLIGLMLPIVSSMQRGARAAECVSNLRQQGMALMNYTAENDGILLSAGQDAGGSWFWTMQIQKYLQGPDYVLNQNKPFDKVSYCPDLYTSDPRGKKRAKYTWSWVVGYTMNAYPGYGEGGDMNKANRIRMNSKGERIDTSWTTDFRYDQITHKSVRPWLLDGSEWQTGVNPAPSTAGAQYGGLDFNRHGKDKSNVLFFDLHVEAGVSQATIKTGLKEPVKLDQTSVL